MVRWMNYGDVIAAVVRRVPVLTWPFASTTIGLGEIISAGTALVVWTGRLGCQGRWAELGKREFGDDGDDGNGMGNADGEEGGRRGDGRAERRG
jgi:hypothetical protein